MVFGMFHADLCVALERQGLSVPVPRSGVTVFGQSESQLLEEQFVPPLAYMDDFFIPIEAQSAEDWIPDMLLAAQVVHAVAAKYGLTFNFETILQVRRLVSVCISFDYVLLKLKAKLLC